VYPELRGQFGGNDPRRYRDNAVTHDHGGECLTYRSQRDNISVTVGYKGKIEFVAKASLCCSTFALVGV
ncbi:uncharacterized protein METZ01_LOCUS330997, partial [marine metagenome]